MISKRTLKNLVCEVLAELDDVSTELDSVKCRLDEVERKIVCCDTIKPKRGRGRPRKTEK